MARSGVVVVLWNVFDLCDVLVGHSEQKKLKV